MAIQKLAYLSADPFNKSVLIRRKKRDLFFVTSSFLGLSWYGLQILRISQKSAFGPRQLKFVEYIFSYFDLPTYSFKNHFFGTYRYTLTVDLLVIITLLSVYCILNPLHSLLRERDTKLRKTFAIVNNFSPAYLKTAFVNVLINVKLGCFFFLFFQRRSFYQEEAETLKSTP